MFYVLCDDNCRHESMTKEQILSAIQSAIENGSVQGTNAVAFSKFKEICSGATKQIWVGTEAQFNALEIPPETTVSAVRIGNDGVLYLCTDDSTLGAPYEHANSTDNPHRTTYDQVGAAKADHTHTLSSLNIIFSSTAPAVVNGGIWLQPQE